MKFLRKYNENSNVISIFDQNWENLLPLKLVLITNNGNFTLKRVKKLNKIGHTPDVINLMNGLQIMYNQNTPNDENGDVLRDGEPDTLQFDICFPKNNDGRSADPDNIRLNVDITYGDAMACEFTIEKPNKINIIHYTGIGSKYDPDTFFGFDDKSINELIIFFNRFGFELTSDDLTFIDKYPDSYIHTSESIKLSPSFNKDYLLIIDESKKSNLDNIIKYLKSRGILYKIAEDSHDINKFNNELNIIGIISYSGTSFSLLNCPVLSIAKGMLDMCKYYGSTINKEDYIHGSYKLDYYENCDIFNGADMNTMKVSFSTKNYINKCPNNFAIIGKIKDKLVSVYNKSKKIYGVLFNPENIESTHIIIDNFVQLCKGNIDDQALLKGEDKNEMQYLKKFEYFIKNNL